MANPTRKKGQSHKVGRFKFRCAAYRSSHKQEKNQVRRLRKHLRGQPGDKQAQGRLANLALYT